MQLTNDTSGKSHNLDFFFSNLYTGQWRKRGLLGWAVFKCLATCRKSVCRKRKDKKPLTPLYHLRSFLVLLTRTLFFFFLKENIGILLLIPPSSEYQVSTVIQPMTKNMCVFKRMHSSNEDLEYRYLLKTCMISCIWI